MSCTKDSRNSASGTFSTPTEGQDQLQQRSKGEDEDDDDDDDELAGALSGAWRSGLVGGLEVGWRWVGGGLEDTHHHTQHDPSPAHRHIITSHHSTANTLTTTTNITPCQRWHVHYYVYNVI
jgi:hypothetical protein